MFLAFLDDPSSLQFGKLPKFSPAPDDDETYSWAMSSHEDSEASCAEQDEQHTLTVGKAETGGDGRMG